MKNIFYITIFLFPFLGFAQQLEQTLITCYAGQTSLDSTMHIQFGLGELSTSEYLHSTQLMEGFHHCSHVTGTTRITENRTLQVSVFPNPSIDLIYLKSPIYPVQFQILNAQGKVVISDTIYSNQEEIVIKQLPEAMYWINCTNSKIASQSIPFVKSNI